MLHIPSVKAASTLEDGRYTVNFEILNGDASNNSTSLADGYWNKPATVIVKNGEITVQTEVNKQEWVLEFSTKFNGSFKNVKNVSVNTAANSRIDEFKVASLDETLESKMHIVVDSIDYDHHHKVRFKFLTDTLQLVSASEPAKVQTPEKEPEAVKPQVTTEEASSNGQTASTSPPPKETNIKSSAEEKPITVKPEISEEPKSTDGSIKAGSKANEVKQEEVKTVTEMVEDTEGNSSPDIALEEEVKVISDESQDSSVEQATTSTDEEVEVEEVKEGRGVNRIILMATIIGVVLTAMLFFIFSRLTKKQS